ncbi:MAG TPA: winged helix-turn-helix domain-containing protein [Bryobacteraceae bacterium]|nr:winged helix-turn-helix domain-containing protein [Bryobacteraceae bacterium]
MSSVERHPGEARREYRFGDYTLDLERGLLRCGLEEIALRAKTLDVLTYLIERQGRLVTKGELIEAVWPDCTVTDNSLAQCIVEIRRALGHSSQQLLQTVARRGYVFTAPAILSFPALANISGERPFRAAEKASKTKLIGSLSLALLAAAGTLIVLFSRPSTNTAQGYTQLTSFTDSAVAPALSPDGRMVAFLRSDRPFLTADQIYIKLLPNGEPVQVTNDPRLKYNVAFSPDGSRIAYTVFEAGAAAWNTYTVSSLGGAPQLLLSNAAGLTWLDEDRLLFSAVKKGIHMGIVTASENRSDYHSVYFSPRNRAMAHYSFASPDRKWALVAEMDPDWQVCRLVPLDGSSEGSQVGPPGPCTAAAWSPDSRWMYFAASVDGNSHLWRQHFPAGKLDQITFGPTQESGIAMAPDGKSLITSIGTQQSALWIHDFRGDRPLSSEGYLASAFDRHVASEDGFFSYPSFSSNGKHLYYLLRRQSPGSASELWRMDIDSGESALVLPGFSIREYDISSDEREVVFRTQPSGERSQLWLARLDRSSAPRWLAGSEEAAAPRFGPHGEVLFRWRNGETNYLARMNRDGSARAKVIAYPITTLENISPDRRWVITITRPDYEADNSPALIPEVAVPVLGGSPRRVCPGPCAVAWSPDQKWFYVGVVPASRTDPGKTIVLPIPPGQSLPNLPAAGIGSLEEGLAVPGARIIEQPEVFPGTGFGTYVYVKTTVHRNLFRIPLPSWR